MAASAPVPIACLRLLLRTPQDWTLMGGLEMTHQVTTWCGQHKQIGERERVSDLTYGEAWRNIQQHGMGQRALADSVGVEKRAVTRALIGVGFSSKPRARGLLSGPCCRCGAVHDTGDIVPYLWVCFNCEGDLNKGVLGVQRTV